MRYTAAAKRPLTDWQTRFAFFPTAVGEDTAGKVVKVWLEKYEERYTGKFNTLFNEIERRPHNNTDNTIKIYCAWHRNSYHP